MAADPMPPEIRGTAPAALQGPQGLLSDIAGKIINALPPSFIMLCLVNVAFLGIVMRFIAEETSQRADLMSRMLDVCLKPNGVP